MRNVVAMTRKVLLVDDEPNVLSGLRRMLRPLQGELTAAFADGGPAALAVLEREPFDVIVSDMRMPGMSGAQLLEEVGRRFPGMVRIILTGQCDEESGLRAVRVAHQMLHKPCDAATLKATLAGACSLGAWIADEKLQAIVTRQASLPSLPTHYHRLMDEMAAAVPSLETVAGIISRDIGMSAKLLHVVNSSFFGLRRAVAHPKHAVAIVGLDAIWSLIAAGVFARSDASGLPAAVLAALHSHGSATKARAGAIMRAEGADPREVERAGVAGFLHGVGKLILLDNWPDEYAAVIAQVARTGGALWEAEMKTFGVSHAELGACLLELWGLPPAIVEAVAWQHQPSRCPRQTFGALTAVHAGNALSAGGTPDRAYLQRLNLLHRLPAWQELRRTHHDERELAHP